MTKPELSTSHARYHLTLVDHLLATNDPLIGVPTLAIALVAVVGLLMAAAWR